MYRLPDEHLVKAKEIAVENRKNKSCNKCYDRGYIGTTEENLLVLCEKCVEMDKAMDLWKNYVASVPELKEQFAELFEEDSSEE